jgi:hypothetical protein
VQEVANHRFCVSVVLDVNIQVHRHQQTRQHREQQEPPIIVPEFSKKQFGQLKASQSSISLHEDS